MKLIKIISNKLRRLDKPHKIIVSIGFPILSILLVAGITNFITDVLNIGRRGSGIDPFEIEESWWVWFIAIMSIMLFEWVLYSNTNNSSSHKDHSSQASLSAVEYKQIFSGNHPWRRYFARIVDITIFGNILLIMLLVIIIMISPELLSNINSLEQGVQIIVSTMMLFAIWVPFETLFLFTLGTTPAKWVFGISVTTTEGKKLNFRQALCRSISVWARGLCFGIPPLTTFSMLYSLKKLNIQGQTYWDEAYHTRITHKAWDAWRAIFSFLSVMIAIFVIALLETLLKIIQ